VWVTYTLHVNSFDFPCASFMSFRVCTSQLLSMTLLLQLHDCAID